ncbi:MAG: YjbQ family protein [Candidatus Tectomicrobia bacterium]|uniref:YjbQ family protein n=1 Tax=Tectimicrobiota bacterium TaxID=2528274 RepID=A0A932M0H5_UNCTE|nr:YjbQ family protein [Candidatus Tectomicrobia bacterium]
MGVVCGKFTVQTKGQTEIIDITKLVARQIEQSNLGSGTATVFVAGSTAGVTTLEHEPGLLKDLEQAWERICPRDIPYAHDSRWGDGNGYAHVRAALLGPSLTIPFFHQKLLLGVWQQIVLVDFDNRPRIREISVQIIGE